MSRLTKRRFFERFIALATTRPDWQSLIELHTSSKKQLMYASLKRAAHAFDEAKEKLQASLLSAKYGKWVKKPLEQDQFEITINTLTVGRFTNMDLDLIQLRKKYTNHSKLA